MTNRRHTNPFSERVAALPHQRICCRRCKLLLRPLTPGAAHVFPAVVGVQVVELAALQEHRVWLAGGAIGLAAAAVRPVVPLLVAPVGVLEVEVPAAGHAVVPVVVLLPFLQVAERVLDAAAPVAAVNAATHARGQRGCKGRAAGIRRLGAIGPTANRRICVQGGHGVPGHSRVVGLDRAA